MYRFLLQIEECFGISEPARMERMAINPKWGLQLKQRYEAGLARLAEAASAASGPGVAAAASQGVMAPPAGAVIEAIIAPSATANVPSTVAGAAQVSRRQGLNCSP
jgi:hypothetical protein